MISARRAQVTFGLLREVSAVFLGFCNGARSSLQEGDNPVFRLLASVLQAASPSSYAHRNIWGATAGAVEPGPTARDH